MASERHSHLHPARSGPGGSRFAMISIGCLLVGLALYIILPLPMAARENIYSVVATSSIAVAFLGLMINRPAPFRGWLVVVLGFSTWVLGDVVWNIEYSVFDSYSHPGFSDAIYISGYIVMASGGLMLVRSQEDRGLQSLLDASIAAVGVGVALGVFVLVPLATERDTTLAADLVTTAYPLGDLLLLFVLVRLWTAPDGFTWAYGFLMAAIGATFVADVAESLRADIPMADSPMALEAGWLTGYVLLACAMLSPGHSAPIGPPSTEEEHRSQRRSLVVLSLASTLPALVLLLTGALGNDVPWLLIGIGSLAMSALVLTRMRGLITQVQAQSRQLATVARRDALTGIPNRRSWDYELARACERGRELGTSVCVAILDLDHFKTYNDTHGHPTGDQLLRDVSRAMSQLVGEVGTLARYGGEEFTVLVEDMDLDEFVTLVERLRAAVPDGQTFSAGVARWNASTDPSTVVDDADEALYVAKRAGRDRTEVYGRNRQ
ncbi:GGDEF domain-containing protein [Nocardioides pacificus]